jgi:hypothetical protein
MGLSYDGTLQNKRSILETDRLIVLKFENSI